MPYSDPEIRRAYLRDYKRRHRTHMAALNAASDRARNANRRAEKYGADGRVTIDELRDVLAGAVCHYCGIGGSGANLGIDHVIPLHAGGANRPENIVPCCRACNASKWRSERPWRWSRALDACRSCGTSSRRHCAGGLCGRCYQRSRKESPA